MSERQVKNHAAFIWSVADLLRGDYKQSEYGRVILPLVVIRRLDCVLEPTKDAVLEAHARHSPHVSSEERLAPFLEKASLRCGRPCVCTSAPIMRPRRRSACTTRSARCAVPSSAFSTSSAIGSRGSSKASSERRATSAPSRRGWRGEKPIRTPSPMRRWRTFFRSDASGMDGGGC